MDRSDQISTYITARLIRTCHRCMTVEPCLLLLLLDTSMKESVEVFLLFSLLLFGVEKDALRLHRLLISLNANGWHGIE